MRVPFVTVNGYRLHYLDEGQGPVLVLGHGLTMDHEMFADQIEALRDRYRIIAPDWRGHGQSESQDRPYTMEDQADDLYQLLTQLGIRQAHIGGMSMGGMIALRFALAHPEMTRSLILIDTDAGPEDPARAPQYEAMATVFRQGQGAALVDAVMQILFAQPFFREQPERAAHWREKLLRLDPTGIYHATCCVTRRTDIRDRVGAIQAPTLVICGEDDIATPPEKSRFLAEAIPGARLVMVPQAGHTTPLERPEAVTAAIRDFLADVEARSAA